MLIHFSVLNFPSLLVERFVSAAASLGHLYFNMLLIKINKFLICYYFYLGIPFIHNIVAIFPHGNITITFFLLISRVSFLALFSVMNIDVGVKNARNLSVLSGIDKSIVEIVSDVSHIAVYEFDSTWKRYNVEGACFVVRRKSPTDIPSFCVIVLNKQGLENFILDLSDCKKVKMQDRFIMLKVTMKKKPMIFGLWMHSDDEREQMFAILAEKQKLIADATNPVALEMLTDKQISRGGGKASSTDLPLSPASRIKSILQIQQQESRKLLSPSDFTGDMKTFYLS